MLNKTHVAIGVFFMFFFVTKVVHVWVYVFVFVLATLLPNVDRLLSFKRFKLFNRRGDISRRRGFFHSFTFCLVVTGLLAWFLPTFAFPFFLAYGTHLIADSWTVEGIKPFWPLRYVVKGRVKSGGSVENVIFYSFVVADVTLIWFMFL